MAIEVLSPLVNHSSWDVKAHHGKGAVGLEAIKNVGQKDLEAVSEPRNSGAFTSILDKVPRRGFS